MELIKPGKGRVRIPANTVKNTFLKRMHELELEDNIDKNWSKNGISKFKIIKNHDNYLAIYPIPN